jgi:hypothetical protein
VLALAWATSSHAPLPIALARWTRPALPAACAVLLVPAAVVVALGLAVAPLNRPLAAGLLLAGPNLLCALLSAGAGVTWSLDGPAAFNGLSGPAGLGRLGELGGPGGLGGSARFLVGLVPAPAVATGILVVVVAAVAFLAVRRADRLVPLVVGMAVVMGAAPWALAWLGGLSVSAGFVSFGVTGHVAPWSGPLSAALGALAGACAYALRARRLKAVRTGRPPGA